jgi:hypothetical protein
VHVEAPAWEKVPAGHEAEVAMTAPTAVENVPAGFGVQLVAPTMLLKVPGGQIEQKLEFFWLK